MTETKEQIDYIIENIELVNRAIQENPDIIPSLGLTTADITFLIQQVKALQNRVFPDQFVECGI